ncbi:MAG: PilZ domain-containing protein [Pyrinomonadaceae bacterium]|nr:PilZ domain-containing protein [Pyrinomonadaceae bacterium]
MDITSDGKTRRSRERLKLSLPVRVTCRESVDHQWTEVTRLGDVTPFGTGFTLTRPTEAGRLLHLTLPMPRQLRCFDHTEQQYRVWSIVRKVKTLKANSAGAPQFSIGVAFIGKHPPANFDKDPAIRYDIDPAATASGLWQLRPQSPATAAQSRSQETRLHMPVEVVIEVLDDKGQVSAREETVTQNISRRGAAIYTTLQIERGRFVRLTSVSHGLTVAAAVRGCRAGADNIVRMHLEFVDEQWPLEGVE